MDDALDYALENFRFPTKKDIDDLLENADDDTTEIIYWVLEELLSSDKN